MFFLLFLLFTLLPLIELTLLVSLGQATDWWVPILLVIATGIAGAALARWQGWQVMEQIRREAASGRMPADALIDGLLVLLAGILLISPGIVTDVAGCALLVPPIRALVKRGMAAWIKRKVEVRVARITRGFREASDGTTPSGRDRIIDAQVVSTRVEDAQ